MITKSNFYRVEKILEKFGLSNIDFSDYKILTYTYDRESVFNFINRYAYVRYEDKTFIIKLKEYQIDYDSYKEFDKEFKECCEFIQILEETVLRRISKTGYTDIDNEMIYEDDVLEDEHGRQLKVIFDASPEYNEWVIDDEYGGYCYSLKDNCKRHKLVYGQLEPING
jgi:hypothetical protein